MLDNVLINKYHDCLVSTFKRTISFLNDSGIRWFVAYGTAIGAVRHNGIIPWDDDIDIYVPREDYERLFSVRSSLRNYNLDMKSIEDGCGYYNGFIKIYNDNTTLWEIREYENIVGVYVDVFPLDQSNISQEEFMLKMNYYRKSMERYRRANMKIKFSYLLELLNGLHFKTLLKYVVVTLLRPELSDAYNSYLKSTRQIEYNADGKYMMCLMGSYGDKERVLSEWFEDYIEWPFYDFTVRLPIGYENYLTHLYGDYMQLPPIEKRVSNHCHYYCNLKEKLSLDEVKRRIKNGEFYRY